MAEQFRSSRKCSKRQAKKERAGRTTARQTGGLRSASPSPQRRRGKIGVPRCTQAMNATAMPLKAWQARFMLELAHGRSTRIHRRLLRTRPRWRTTQRFSGAASSAPDDPENKGLRADTRRCHPAVSAIGKRIERVPDIEIRGGETHIGHSRGGWPASSTRLQHAARRVKATAREKCT